MYLIIFLINKEVTYSTRTKHIQDTKVNYKILLFRNPLSDEIELLVSNYSNGNYSLKGFIIWASLNDDGTRKLFMFAKNARGINNGRTVSSILDFAKCHSVSNFPFLYVSFQSWLSLLASHVGKKCFEV